MSDEKRSALSVLRPIIYVLVIVGAVGYYFHYREARRAYQVHNQAVEHINNRRYAEAVNLLETLPLDELGDAELRARAKTHLAWACAEEGRRLFRAGEHAEALALLERAVEVSPEEAKKRDAALFIGKSLRKLGRTDDALAALRRAARDGNREAERLVKRIRDEATASSGDD